MCHQLQKFAYVAGKIILKICNVSGNQTFPLVMLGDIFEEPNSYKGFNVFDFLSQSIYWMLAR